MSSELLSKQHISVFCKVLDIGEDRIQRLYVNPGRSANNQNYVIVVDGQSYLYRVPGHGTELFCSREREALAYKLLAPLRITDEVVFLDTRTGVKISKYYENSRIPHSSNRDELSASMRLLRRLHESNISLGVVDTLFDRMERYRLYALEAGGATYYKAGYDEYLSQMRCFRATVETEDRKLCFTHGDASINNILVTREHSHPILIDMEFPAMSDPFDDIATFCVDAGYRRDDILLMLNYYLEREATPREQYYLLGLCAVAAMMWYSWAAYKSAVSGGNQQFIDFRNDYHEYVGDVYADARLIYEELSAGRRR